ncbi:MAG: pantoate--beta-alanine ligase [Verrucomicrobiota bacterium JB023]|nr:pantoate--beta-alanine ligase [Verrucomicrobiota bacterium JB023]
MQASSELEALELARTHWTRPLAFVPTMGALHQGHLDLIDLARQTAGHEGTVVVSIFVNPLQFDRKEDLASYPQTLDHDLELCRSKGVNFVYHPLAEDFYAPDHSIHVHEKSLSRHLCGASRPGHFDGVCTVVLKLLNTVRPDYAIFGKKDYQQLAIIKRLVRDLSLHVQIVGAETTREDDGLALSSRNRNLTEAQRADAPRIRRSLLAARQLVESGETSAEHILTTTRQELLDQAPADFSIDYLEIVDQETLLPRSTLDGPSLMAVAAFYGSVRLIDNIELELT